MSLDSPISNAYGNSLISEEQQKKIDEVRKLLGPVPENLFKYCLDPSICRYLRARGWNVKKAARMMKESIKWRLEYKPEQIRWEEVAHEAETGKLYRSPYTDKHGRTVLVMRPSRQNSKSTRAQIKYLVYCMENAIMNLPENLEEMVWLVDFDGFNLSNISFKSTRETAHVLQEYYPERLGVAILYNPPKFFEPFYMLVKPFLEHKTANKVKFVYSSDPITMKIMEDTFDVDKLESAFGGKDTNASFEINKYAERMREDDKKMPYFWARHNDDMATPQPSVAMTAPSFSPKGPDLKSNASSNGEVDDVSLGEAEDVSVDNKIPMMDSCSEAVVEVK